jgi:Protein of unknown function (DUF3574)
LNSRTRLWQIGGTWGALPRAHRAYQVRRSVSVSNVAAVTTRQVNDRSPVTWWPLPRSVLPSKGATIARAGVVDWRRGPLDESKERATVTFQKRYSNGQKCRHHDDRGGGRVKEAERGIRQGKLQGRGIRRASSGLVLVCAFVLAALRLVPAQADSETSAVLTCAPNGTAMSKVELYFGTARNGRRPVSAPDWAHFVEAQIGPRFPEGFTVLQGQGRWRTSRGAIVKETSHVVIIWYRPALSVETRIEAIRAAYRRQFSQESVMRADSSGCVSFQ